MDPEATIFICNQIKSDSNIIKVITDYATALQQSYKEKKR